MVQTEQEINELLKNDPFIKLWENNYSHNFLEEHFNKATVRPLMFLVNTAPYQRIPVVLVVAGPSIDKNIKVLKQYENNAIIVCADVILFKLLEHGIKPDFVVNVDPHASITRFIAHLDTSDLCLVCPTTTNPKTLETWKGRIFFYNQTDVANNPKGLALKRITRSTQGWGSIFNQFFIGATMLQFSAILRPSIVILAGYDFAYTDNKAYCDGFMHLKIYTDWGSIEAEGHGDVIKQLEKDELKKELEVQLSNKTSIWTSKTLHFYKQSFMMLVQSLRIPIINSTEGGILVEVPNIPLEKAMQTHCSSPIVKKDVFALPKRKRKRR